MFFTNNKLVDVLGILILFLIFFLWITDYYLIGDGSYILFEQLRINYYHLPGRYLGLISASTIVFLKLFTSDIVLIKKVFGLIYYSLPFCSTVYILKRRWLSPDQKVFLLFFMLLLLIGTRATAARVYIFHIVLLTMFDERSFLRFLGKCLIAIAHPFSIFIFLFEIFLKKKLSLVNAFFVVLVLFLQYINRDYNFLSVQSTSVVDLITPFAVAFALSSIVYLLRQKNRVFEFLIIPSLIGYFIYISLEFSFDTDYIQFGLKYFMFFFPFSLFFYLRKLKTNALNSKVVSFVFVLLLGFGVFLILNRRNLYESVKTNLTSYSLKCIDKKDYIERFSGRHRNRVEYFINDKLIYTLMLEPQPFQYVINVNPDASCHDLKVMKSVDFFEHLKTHNFESLRPVIQFDIWK